MDFEKGIMDIFVNKIPKQFYLFSCGVTKVGAVKINKSDSRCIPHTARYPEGT